MAMRDADGFSLDLAANTAGSGVSAIREVASEEPVTLYQEEVQGMLKTFNPHTGAITVEPLPIKPRRPLKHSEIVGPDGNIYYRQGGTFVHDEGEIIKDRSRQEETLAEEKANEALMKSGLTPEERMKGVVNFGSTKRDGNTGKLIEVCGKRVPNRNAGESYEPGLQPGLRWPEWPDNPAPKAK